MSVRQNLEYGLKNRKTPRAEIATRVAEAARILEIEPFLDRRPRQLSGGQRQRVAMGRAIVRQPKAFLFDEPLSNLDAKLRGQMRVEIRKLQKRLGTTSLYVTHDQLEAMTLADKLVVMNAGHIEQTGSPTELYERPATLFVAGFIGSPPMNIIKVAALPGPDAARVQQMAPGIATIGIRPDALEPTATPGALALSATVALIEPIGAESHVHLRWQDQLLVAQMRGTLDFTDGDTITLYASPTAIHCFDAEGRRLPVAAAA
jgi:sn-glycerol 3-phosphate transport system ATP-binding protein